MSVCLCIKPELMYLITALFDGGHYGGLFVNIVEWLSAKPTETSRLCFQAASAP